MNQGIVSTRSQSTSNDNLDDRIKLKIILANDILPQNTKEEIEDIVKNQETLSDRLNLQKKKIEDSLLVWSSIKDRKINTVYSRNQIGDIPESKALAAIEPEDDGSISSVSISSATQDNASPNTENGLQGKKSSHKRISKKNSLGEQKNSKLRSSNLDKLDESPISKDNTNSSVSNLADLQLDGSQGKHDDRQMNSPLNTSMDEALRKQLLTQVFTPRVRPTTNSAIDSQSIEKRSISSKHSSPVTVSSTFATEKRFDEDPYALKGLGKEKKSSKDIDMNIFKSPASRQRHGNINTISLAKTVRCNQTSTSLVWRPTKLTNKYNDRFQTTQDLLFARKVYPVLYGDS